MSGKPDLTVNDIIRRKRDGFEFIILEIHRNGEQTILFCRDIHHRLHWNFDATNFDEQFEKVFKTRWGQNYVKD